MTTSEVLIESLIETLAQFPKAPHIRLGIEPGMGFPALTADFKGTFVYYEEGGKIHTAYFDGDEQPYADARETDSQGFYRANREAASFIVKKGREGTLRLIMYPAFLEYFASESALRKVGHC